MGQVRRSACLFVCVSSLILPQSISVRPLIVLPYLERPLSHMILIGYHLLQCLMCYNLIIIDYPWTRASHGVKKAASKGS